MTGILNALIAGVSGAVKDTYFNLVSLLLPGNGTDGKQNRTFLDGSSNNFTITPNGNTTQGTFSPFSQTGWGNYFNGSSYLQVASNAAFAFGTGDFSMEFWFYPTVAATQRNISFPTANAPILNMTSSRTLEFGNYGISTIATTSNTLTLNAWNFCAASRVSGTLRLFINGDQGASVPDSTNFVQSLVNIGTDTGGIFATGYMADVRIVKGSGFTTSTVPIAPLTAISGTSLLTCQSNRFRDASGNGFTITTSGSPSVVAFSPFAPTQSYSAAAVGGSGYFDGTVDSLQIADTTELELGASNFTIEAWIYATATPGASGATIIGKNSATYPSGYEFNLVLDNARTLSFNVYTSTLVSLQGTTVIPLNAWTHVAASRSGSDYAIYVNGTREDLDSAGGTIQSTTSNIYIGDYGGGSRNLTGYIASLRVVKGSYVYNPSSTNVTIPTAPLTAITDTKLLLNFTNAGVVDATAKNVLETVGNAQISTTQSKWGGGSISFASASNSNLLGNTPSNWTFLHDGSTWTVEFWLYPTNVSSFQGLIATNGAGSTNTGISFAINAGAISISFTRGVSGSSASFTSSAVLNANQWNYVGVTFTGSTKTCAFFINGASAGSSSNTGFAYSSSTATYPPYIGQTGDPSYPYYFNGYIDDLRITRGVARTITANPTAPFPVQ